MFGSLGLPEILFILVIALLVFGPRRLPEIGRTIGKALGEFRRATTDLKRSIDTEVTLEEVRTPPPPPSAATGGTTPRPAPSSLPSAEPAPAAPAEPVPAAPTAEAEPRPAEADNSD
jgi:TatA/E family protein of Tat protein translocase